MNKQLTINEVAPIVVDLLKNETIPVTKQNIFDHVREHLGVKSTAAAQRLNRILDQMVLMGYLYTVDNVVYKLTRDAAQDVGREGYTKDYSQLHRDILGGYKKPLDAVKAIKPYWEHFKENHREYSEAYEYMESIKEFPMFLAEVWDVINNKAVQPYKGVETDYVYNDRLASSIDNVIASCLIRAIKYSKIPKLRSVMTPNEKVINITRDFLGTGFEDLKNQLLTSIPVGSVLSREGVTNFIRKNLSSIGVNENSQVDFVVGHVINKLIDSIPPESGILFDSMGGSKISSGIRNILFGGKFKTSSKDIINNIRDNGRGVVFLSNAMSGFTIPAGSKLKDCNFNGITMGNTVAKNVTFNGSTFSGSTITGCDFEKANFTRCQLDVVKFTQNNINDAVFTNSGGYNSEHVDFSNNKGKPIGLTIQKAIYNTDDFNKLVQEGMKRKQYNSLPMTQPERLLTDSLLQHLHGFLTHKGRRLSSLESIFKFSEEDPDIPKDTNIIKKDLETMLSSGQKSEWLESPKAKEWIIQLNKSGELGRMGLGPSVGKIMNLVSGPKAPSKEQVRVEQKSEQDTKLQEVFEQHVGRGTLNKKQLLDALPKDAVNLRALINQFPHDQLDAQQVSQIYTVLLNSQYDTKAGDSVLLQQQLRNISQFPHGSRIDDITSGRRNPVGEAGAKYPNTFGVILEPNLNGLPSEVRSIMEMIDIGSPYNLKYRKFVEGMPHNQHWMNAFASARVRPTYVVDNSGVEGSVGKRNVWLDVENQSDAIQNAEEYFSRLSKSSTLPFKLGSPEIMIISQAYDLTEGKMGVVIPLSELEKYKDKYNINKEKDNFKDSVNNLISHGYLIKEGDGIALNPDHEEGIKGMKSIVAFRNYFRDWPEMVMLEVVKRALEHGGVDEVWVPTFEDLMKSERRKGKDRRPYYDYAALRLGGVPFRPSMDITPDAGSDIWSNTDKSHYPKTWYSIDLLPYKLDLRKGNKCSSKTSSESVATVTDLNKFSKYKKSLNNMEVVTPNLYDSQIVVVYQLSNAPGKFFISSCKDFNDNYTVRQLYSSVDLTYSGDIYSSLYKDKVLRYVERQLNDYPYLRNIPRNMLVASGIVRRQDEYNLSPEEVNQLAQEMQESTSVTMDIPIINYVKVIITVVDHVKQGLGSEDSVIKNVVGNLVHDKIGSELVSSVIKNVLPEALKAQPKEPEEEKESEGLSFEPSIEDYKTGDIGLEGGSGLEFGDEPKTEKRPLADNDPRKKYVDLTFDQNQMSPQGLERHKQKLIDEYLEDLSKAKEEGNENKVKNINKMLEYLSKESSLYDNLFFEYFVRVGGLAPIKYGANRRKINKNILDIINESVSKLLSDERVDKKLKDEIQESIDNGWVYFIRKDSKGNLYVSHTAPVGTAFCPKCYRHFEDCKCPEIPLGNSKTPALHDFEWYLNDTPEEDDYSDLRF